MYATSQSLRPRSGFILAVVLREEALVRCWEIVGTRMTLPPPALSPTDVHAATTASMDERLPFYPVVDVLPCTNVSIEGKTGLLKPLARWHCLEVIVPHLLVDFLLSSNYSIFTSHGIKDLQTFIVQALRAFPTKSESDWYGWHANETSAMNSGMRTKFRLLEQGLWFHFQIQGCLE